MLIMGNIILRSDFLHFLSLRRGMWIAHGKPKQFLIRLVIKRPVLVVTNTKYLIFSKLPFELSYLCDVIAALT